MKRVVSSMRMTTALVAAAFLLGVFLAPTAAIAADEPLTAAEAREIGKEVFFWGMHPVGIYHLRYNFAQNELNPRAAGINLSLIHISEPTRRRDSSRMPSSA